jgi:RNA polymerase sigma-70 factor (ECF subfamily)
VWRDLRGPLLNFITRRVSDRDSAEDILQDVMLRIHRHADELTDGWAVGAWIHAIARNAIIDHYRRAVVRREQPTGSELELERPTPPDPNQARQKREPSWPLAWSHCWRSCPRSTARRSSSPIWTVLRKPMRPPTSV